MLAVQEASWWGNNFVLSGSDCGHFFAWDARTADIVLIKVRGAALAIKVSSANRNQLEDGFLYKKLLW